MTRRYPRIALVGLAFVLSIVGLAPSHATPPPINDRSASLVGRVTDAVTGDAVGDAEITLTPAGSELPPSPISDRTTDGGHYLFKGLAAGHYFVQVMADGYPTYGGTGRGCTDCAGGSTPTVTMSGGPSIQHLDIAIPPPVTD